MARLHDNFGRLTGGFDTRRLNPQVPPPETTPAEADAHKDPPRQSPPAPKWGSDEVVFGLECSYGSLAYSYSGVPNENGHERSHHHGCHNPVEEADERHKCDTCGGDYCSVHAEPAAHECLFVVAPL